MDRYHPSVSARIKGKFPTCIWRRFYLETVIYQTFKNRNFSKKIVLIAKRSRTGNRNTHPSLIKTFQGLHLLSLYTEYKAIHKFCMYVPTKVYTNKSPILYEHNTPTSALYHRYSSMRTLDLLILTRYRYDIMRLSPFGTTLPSGPRDARPTRRHKVLSAKERAPTPKSASGERRKESSPVPDVARDRKNMETPI